ncbi:pep-cterm sorting domain-containing protein [Anaeramoeba ignava]|uniref:Pep-cterm sorting domain-containing protein n=1 Tax=Anaeramoeba ignava TaxID=1746090 RepID=A0A9Q0LKI6_ANAIG|nr:pep-cterm sorting domain-containing protein [Anaeramoeba ignava]
MKEYQENKLILKDVSSSILFSILNYFYSGKIKINLENAIQILIFSSKYLIDDLIQICSNFIKNNLQFETVIDVLKLCESMKINKLLESCYKFIFKNLEKFIKTSFFLELEENHLNLILSNDNILINEFKIFQSIIKWGKHKSNINQIKENEKLEKEEKEKIQDQISNIIQKIRFIDFTKQELTDTLKQNLIPNQISQKLNNLLKLKTNKNKKEIKELIKKEKSKSNIFKTRFHFKSTIIKKVEHYNKLKKWINDDEFFSNLILGYSAKIDGFDCKKWHDRCDDQGKTLIIIKTKDNFIFGGFTEVGFSADLSELSEEDSYYKEIYIKDPNAFIFSLRNDKNNRKPKKFPVKKDYEKTALHYEPNWGPIFGDEDISLNRTLTSGTSELGWFYKLPKGIKSGTNEAKSYLAGSPDKWEVDELETYFI